MPSILPDLPARLVRGGVVLGALCASLSMAMYMPAGWAQANTRPEKPKSGIELSNVPSATSVPAVSAVPGASGVSTSKPSAVGSAPFLFGDSIEGVMSWTEESRLGARAFNHFRQEGAWLDDPEIDSYLQHLVDKLRLRAGPWATRRIRVKAVADSGINAFALPGGVIGVNEGLIRRVDSESELAAVLAHELSHVSQRHVVRMMEAQPNQWLWLIGSIVLAAAAGKQGNSDVAQGAIMAGQAAGIQQQISYTQTFEREADTIGLERLEAAGFDPTAMQTMLDRLQRQSRLMGSQTPAYLRTHPLESERMAMIEDRLKEVPYRQYVSSPEFLLVRALASSYNDSAAEAVERHKKLFESRQYTDERAARYGWAAALLRDNRYPEAEKVIEPLYRQWTHPMVTALYAFSLSKQKKYDTVLPIYRSAVVTWPTSQQLALDYAEALRDAGQHQAALTFLENAIRRMPDFTQAWRIAAECAAALGRKSDQLRYEAQYLGYHQGRWHAAIERAEWGRDAAKTWQDKAVLSSLLKTLKQQAKDAE